MVSEASRLPEQLGGARIDQDLVRFLGLELWSLALPSSPPPLIVLSGFGCGLSFLDKLSILINILRVDE